MMNGKEGASKVRQQIPLDDDETDDEEPPVSFRRASSQESTPEDQDRRSILTEAEEKVMSKVMSHLQFKDPPPKQLPVIEPTEIDDFNRDDGTAMSLSSPSYDRPYSDMELCYRRFIDSWVVVNPAPASQQRDPRAVFVKGHRRVRSNPW